MNRGAIVIGALVAASAGWSGRVLATAGPQPEPDRAVVEESFAAALAVEFPAAVASTVACAIDPTADGWIVLCFGQYFDQGAIHVASGVAPNRDTTEAPPILDPRDWPWEITRYVPATASAGATARMTCPDAGTYVSPADGAIDDIYNRAALLADGDDEFACSLVLLCTQDPTSPVTQLMFESYMPDEPAALVLLSSVCPGLLDELGVAPA